MASPTARTMNDENHAYTPGKDASRGTQNTSSRPALSDVSPNVKPFTTPAPAFLRKPMSGSPLKRSFTAAMEGDEGLTYLKKRKLSEHEVLSQVDGVQEQKGVESQSGLFRPVRPHEEMEDNYPAISVVPAPSPTEPNTPSDKDNDTQDSSADRKSFSSLINYDPSSQQSNPQFKMISNAEMLKLRLRVAMYKIRTNQVEVPFPDLRVEGSSRMPSSLAAVEEAVAQLRREAQAIANRDVKPVPKLLPAPVLLPTTYSSRMIYESQLPSSPPVSCSPDRLPTITTVATPHREVRQLSSPPSSAKRFRGLTEQELTSSVVKGRVAEGLLGLRNAAV